MGDQFSIATTTGTQGQGNSYAPFKSPLYYSDELSTATELSVGGYSAGPLSDSNLTLNWNVALDAAGGGTLQAITGGYEIYSTATPGSWNGTRSASRRRLAVSGRQPDRAGWSATQWHLCTPVLRHR